jgi:flagellar basal-body rod protein FlgB
VEFTMLNQLSGQLEQYMTLLSVRQRLVASNIANADTPDYQTKDIDFESEFRQSLTEPQAAPTVTDVAGLRVKPDGNNVDLDREARLLSENAIRFNVASNLLRDQIKNIRLAISGGGAAA